MSDQRSTMTETDLPNSVCASQEYAQHWRSLWSDLISFLLDVAMRLPSQPRVRPSRPAASKPVDGGADSVSRKAFGSHVSSCAPPNQAPMEPHH